MADVEHQILYLLQDLQKQLMARIGERIDPNQVAVVGGLSEISAQLGLVTSGEFRAGNTKRPGGGFSGVRMAYPALEYGSNSFNIVGVNNDVFQFGIDAASGKALFGGGTVQLFVDGMHVYNGATLALDIDPTGDIVSVGDADFANITARGTLKASVFEKDQASAAAGSIIVAKSAGKLLNDVTTLASPTTFNVDIEDPESGHAAVFQAGDILRLKDGTNDNWITVSSVSDQTTFYRYVCTLSNGTPATFTTGLGVVDYGQSGDGLLVMTADDANGPFYAVLTHAGAPWTTETTRVRLGNLKGVLDYVADAFGIVIGDNNQYLAYDPSGGLRIKGRLVTSLNNPGGFGIYGKSNDDIEPAFDGTETTFYLKSGSFVAGTLNLSLNGIWLEEGAGNDYTEGEQDEFVFVSAPYSGDSIKVDYIREDNGDQVFGETPSGTLNGINTTFTLANAYVADTLQVRLNGQLLRADDDFKQGPQTFTFTTAPQSWDTVIAAFQNLEDTSWVYQEVPTGLINGSNTIFTFANDYLTNSIIVCYNGLWLELTDDFTETDTNEITFVTAPISGSKVWVIYRKA